MFTIKEIYEMNLASPPCKDATGDEDNCCEFGLRDFNPDFVPIIVKELLEKPSSVSPLLNK